MSARDDCSVIVAGERKSLALSSFKGTPGTFRMPAYSTGGLAPTAGRISAVMVSLGSVLRSVQEPPPSFGTKMGDVPEVVAAGFRVEADAAMSLALSYYSTETR